MVEEEVVLVKKLKRQKKEREADPELVEILEKMRRQKMQREDIFSHFEGDTDVEEIYEEDEEEDEEDECAQTEMAEPEYFAEKKKVVRQGPTSRSHYASDDEQMDDFVPSNDEDIDSDYFCDNADDFAEKKLELASGKKRRLKKLKKRVWYDPSRGEPM